MKQLDLFGFWEQPEQQEKIAPPSVKKEDTLSAVESNTPTVNAVVKATDEEPLATSDVTDTSQDDSKDVFINEDNLYASDTAAFVETAPVEDIILASIEPHDAVAATEEPETPVEDLVTNKTEDKAEARISSSIVFEDDKIAVKVKLKPQPKVTEEPAPEVVKTPEKRPILVVVKKRGRKSFKEIDAELDLVEVPDDEMLFEKQYYAISQVAKWFHVNTSLVRYWENEFDILKPRKNRKGDRLFRPEDVKNLQVIYYLLRQRKFSIEGAKKYLKENRKSADTNVQLIQSLTKFRSFLLELKANLGA